VSEKETELPAELATALFRIFQEALTNVGKHAQATRVAVSLCASDNSVSLEVVDNGRGIASQDRAKPRSFGIRGMTERVNALGGKLAIGPAAGGGTALQVRIPLSESEHST
ncbi:MAG TPA: ATP-binding protein, partial [Noviherbaspirillum sp.]|nr:ATP-binding protein [Noviherbaspirillum sp.]